MHGGVSIRCSVLANYRITISNFPYFFVTSVTFELFVWIGCSQSQFLRVFRFHTRVGNYPVCWNSTRWGNSPGQGLQFYLGRKFPASILDSVVLFRNIHFPAIIIKIIIIIIKQAVRKVWIITFERETSRVLFLCPPQASFVMLACFSTISCFVLLTWSSQVLIQPLYHRSKTHRQLRRWAVEDARSCFGVCLCLWLQVRVVCCVVCERVHCELVVVLLRGGVVLSSVVWIWTWLFWGWLSFVWTGFPFPRFLVSALCRSPLPSFDLKVLVVGVCVWEKERVCARESACMGGLGMCSECVCVRECVLVGVYAKFVFVMCCCVCRLRVILCVGLCAWLFFILWARAF